MGGSSKLWCTRRQRATDYVVLAAAAAAGLLVSSGLAAMVGARSGGERWGGGERGTIASRRSTPFNTVVMVDAGSSGCRLNVYRVNGEGESMTVSGAGGGKIGPGLSSFADYPKEVADYIRPLFKHASDLVPAEDYADTRVFIKSTAGMRMLAAETQRAIYDEIYNALADDPLFPFPLDRSHLGTIDGDMEAFYAVLSANYLEGRIDARLHPTGHASGEIGALDMGGASTQIIFRHEKEQPEQTEDGEACQPSCFYEEALGARGVAATAPVSPDDFWGVSHLGYGVAEVRLRIWDYLVEDHLSEGHAGDSVVNPCTFANRIDPWKGHNLVGTGDHLACEEAVAAVLWEGEQALTGDRQCGAGVDGVCGIGGVSMPAPSGDFLAMSVFFYAMHCLHKLGPAELTSWPSPSLNELRDAAEGFCAMDWEALIQREADTARAGLAALSSPSEGLAHRCVEVVYMTTLLRDGYGFPENARNVTFALETAGMELEWTLGYALFELAQGMTSSTSAVISDADAREGGGETMAEESSCSPRGTNVSRTRDGRTSDVAACQADDDQVWPEQSCAADDDDDWGRCLDDGAASAVSGNGGGGGGGGSDDEEDLWGARCCANYCVGGGGGGVLLDSGDELSMKADSNCKEEREGRDGGKAGSVMCKTSGAGVVVVAGESDSWWQWSRGWWSDRNS